MAVDLEEWRRQPFHEFFGPCRKLDFLEGLIFLGNPNIWIQHIGFLGHSYKKNNLYIHTPENSEDVMLSNLSFWNMFQFVDIDARNSQQVFFFGGAILKDGEVVHDLLGRNSLGPS